VPVLPQDRPAVEAKGAGGYASLKDHVAKAKQGEYGQHKAVDPQDNEDSGDPPWSHELVVFQRTADEDEPVQRNQCQVIEGDSSKRGEDNGKLANFAPNGVRRPEEELPTEASHYYEGHDHHTHEEIDQGQVE